MSTRNLDIRERRRDEILGAAATCFVTSGFDGTGMAAIASAAGLSVGGVYRHFPAKEDIVAALVERDLGDHLEHLRNAVEKAPATPPLRRVRAVVGALLDAQIPDHATAALGVEFCAAASRSPRIAALLTDHAQAVAATVANALPVPDATAATETLVTVLDGVMLRTAVGGDDPARRDATAEEITALVMLVVGAAER